MARLALILVLIVIAAMTVAGMVRALSGWTAPETTGNTMPEGVRKISYVALIVLMFGVTTGWLGGL